MLGKVHSEKAAYYSNNNMPEICAVILNCSAADDLANDPEICSVLLCEQQLREERPLEPSELQLIFYSLLNIYSPLPALGSGLGDA